jgi:TRAP-type C4-dicarboxylate transport system substrate-binding protein
MRRATAEAVAWQRAAAVAEHAAATTAITEAGGEILALTAGQHAAFADAVAPLHAEARATYGRELFDLLPPPTGAALPSGDGVT